MGTNCGLCFHSVSFVLMKVFVFCRFALGTFGMDGFLGENVPVVKLKEILSRLKEVYCGTTGYEVKTVSLPDICVRIVVQRLRNFPYFMWYARNQTPFPTTVSMTFLSTCTFQIVRNVTGCERSLKFYTRY